MKIRDIINEEHAEGGPLYVAGRDFDIVHKSDKHKGYVMGATDHSDDDVYKTSLEVYRFVRSEDFEWNGRKFEQDKYEYLSPVIDPKTGREVSPYPGRGNTTEMFDYTVDGLISGSIKRHVVPVVSMAKEDISEGDDGMAQIDIEKAMAMFGRDTVANMLKTKGSNVIFDRDKHGRNWKLVKLPDGKFYIERDFMLEGDSVIFEGENKALVGTILGLTEDAILIEGGTFPLDGDDLAENDTAGSITKAFSDMAGSVKTGLVRRAGLLAMQGRHSEAENTIRHLLKNLDAAVADKIRKSINDIKPVKAGDKIADTSAIEKSRSHTDWLDKTFVPWVENLMDKKLDEAKYKGREVKLGKPMKGDTRKYKVYVRDPKTGNIKKVNFGDKGMEIKRDDPKRRKSFRARHGCGTPRASNRLKAAYWSCRMWSSKPVSKILKGK